MTSRSLGYGFVPVPHDVCRALESQQLELPAFAVLVALYRHRNGRTLTTSFTLGELKVWAAWPSKLDSLSKALRALRRAGWLEYDSVPGRRGHRYVVRLNPMRRGQSEERPTANGRIDGSSSDVRHSALTSETQPGVFGRRATEGDAARDDDPSTPPAIPGSEVVATQASDSHWAAPYDARIRAAKTVREGLSSEGRINKDRLMKDQEGVHEKPRRAGSKKRPHQLDLFQDSPRTDPQDVA
jgi:hypothetical protein